MSYVLDSVTALSQCKSLLPHLVPVAGGTLAISLAYMNLDRFRYSASIRQAALDALSRVDADSGHKLVDKTARYKELRALSLLRGYDNEAGSSENAPHQPDRIDPDLEKDLKLFSVFSTSIDTFCCGFFSIISAVVLLLGCAHAASMFVYTCQFFLRDHIIYYYSLLAFGMFLPALLVSVGSRLKNKCMNRIPIAEDELQSLKDTFTEQLKQQVEQAKLEIDTK